MSLGQPTPLGQLAAGGFGAPAQPAFRAAYLLPAACRALPPAAPTTGDAAAAPSTLVLLPARELAQQVHAVAAAVCEALGLGAPPCAFCGGGSRSQQRREIGRKELAICVGTPGRVQELLEANEGADNSAAGGGSWAGRCGVLVLDEADKLLSGGDGEGGLAGQVDAIFALLGSASGAGAGRELLQWFVSATLSAAVAARVQALPAREASPVWIRAAHGGPDDDAAAAEAEIGGAAAGDGADVAAAAATAADGGEGGELQLSAQLTQTVVVTAEHKKPKKVLKQLGKIQKAQGEGAALAKVLIFCNKNKTVAFVGGLLSRHGHQCAQLHGDLSQAERERALEGL